MGHFVGPSRIASSTTITSALRDFPINLYALDEVGHLFAVNGSRNAGTHKMEILPMFTEVYSKAHGQWDGTGYGDTKMLPKTKIINPHIVFFGVTAPDVMMRALRGGNLGDGSLARFLMLSNDPNFAAKLRAVVGLYVNPPEHAVVLSIDEKSQIQALDRTQPGLPLKKGRCGTMTHDYQRHGTTTLFAALNILDGTVFGRCMQKHRQEFIRFLSLNWRIRCGCRPCFRQMRCTELTLIPMALAMAGPVQWVASPSGSTRSPRRWFSAQEVSPMQEDCTVPVPMVS